MYFKNEILLLVFLLTQFIFVCILWQYCHISELQNTMDIFLVRGMEVAHGQYNVKHYNKHEILLFDTCLLYLYLPPDWLGQHLVTYHNNITQIYSAVVTMFRGIWTHFCHGHVCSGIVNMKTMRLY